MRTNLQKSNPIMLGWLMAMAVVMGQGVKGATIEQGESAFYHGEFTKAIEVLEAVKQELQTVVPFPRDELIKLHIIMGMSYIGMEEASLARQAFQDVILIDPFLELDPEEYSPRVVQVFRDARNEISGRLVVKSFPSAAMVKIDGHTLGKTPIAGYELVAGPHKLELALPYYRAHEETFQLMPGDTREVEVRLIPRDLLQPTLIHEPLVAIEAASIELVCQASDNLTDPEVLVYYTWQGSDSSYETKTLNLSGPHTYRATLEVDKEANELRYYLEARDPDGNHVVSAAPDAPHIAVRVVRDSTPPTITVELPPSIVEGKDFEVVATISEENQLVEVALYYRSLEVSGFESVYLQSDDGQQFSAVIPAAKVVRPGLELYLEAKDDAGNRGAAGTEAAPYALTVMADDVTPPLINHEPLVSIRDTSPARIIATVTDDSAVAEVAVSYRVPGKEFKDFVMVADKSDQYYYDIGIDDISTAGLEYFIRATDVSGKTSIIGSQEEPLAITVLGVEPYTEGYIVDIIKKGKKLMLNLGSKHSLKVNDSFFVVRRLEPIVDPRTSRVIKIPQEIVGEIIIRSIDSMESSSASVESMKGPVRIGDGVRSKPSAPTGVLATSKGLREVEVSWSWNPEPEVQGYKIYRSESREINYGVVAVVKGREETSWLDEGTKKAPLLDNKKYYYRITAYNTLNKESELSAIASALTKGGPLPPLALKAQSLGPRKIDLTWQSSPDETAKGYIIQRAESPEGPFLTIETTKNREVVEFKDQGSAKSPLKDATLYYYSIKAFNKFGTEGKPSSTVSIVTTGPPLAPASLHAINEGLRVVPLSWSAVNDEQVAGYKIYRGTSPDKVNTEIKKLKGRTKTTFVDAGEDLGGLSDGITYYYVVAAYNKLDVEGRRSAVVAGTTAGPPEPPRGFQAKGGQARRVFLRWDRHFDVNVTGYVIQRSLQNQKFETIATVSSRNITTYIDIGGQDKPLLEDALYLYRIAAINKIGVKSNYSEESRAHTHSLLPPPEHLSASTDKVNAIVVKWELNPEAQPASYIIYQELDPGTNPLRIGEVPGNESSFTDTDLNPGEARSYKIRAVGQDGIEGPLSGAVLGQAKKMPATPTGLIGTLLKDRIMLQWEPNPEPDIQGYRVYKIYWHGAREIGFTSQSRYEDPDIDRQAGNEYAIKAVDRDGQESSRSERVTVKAK